MVGSTLGVEFVLIHKFIQVSLHNIPLIIDKIDNYLK
jgi:hypothetical protein